MNPVDGHADSCLPVMMVVAAAIVEEGRLLVVSKKAAPDVFYLPGGKPEAGESAETSAAWRRHVAAVTAPASASRGVLACLSATASGFWLAS